MLKRFSGQSDSAAEETSRSLENQDKIILENRDVFPAMYKCRLTVQIGNLSSFLDVQIIKSKSLLLIRVKSLANARALISTHIQRLSITRIGDMRLKTTTSEHLIESVFPEQE